MRLLAVHPNFELYGSDRSFANAIAALRAAHSDMEITVLFPRKGPILTLPVFSKVTVEFDDMWIPRRGDLNLARLPAFLLRGISQIIAARQRMRHYDFIYINTIISWDYIFAAGLTSRKTAIHVREIATGSELKIFRAMLRWARSALIYNSRSTRDAFALPTMSSYVVYNGTETPTAVIKDPLTAERPLRILVIGRLNAWKGQEVLVEAIARLSPEQRRRVNVRIVGGVFEALDHFREKITKQIAAEDLGDIVTMHPFTDDPTPEYRWADVVVVPSTRPEPFGRVAIEAMAYKAAVVASAHGGPIEIVDDNITGQLFAPSDANALAVALLRYIDDLGLAARHGEAGHRRFLKLFTSDASDRAIVDAIDDIQVGKRDHG